MGVAQRVRGVGQQDRRGLTPTLAEGLEAALGGLGATGQVVERDPHGQGEHHQADQRHQHPGGGHRAHPLARPARRHPIARHQHRRHRHPHAQRREPGEPEGIGPHQGGHGQQADGGPDETPAWDERSHQRERQGSQPGHEPDPGRGHQGGGHAQHDPGGATGAGCGRGHHVGEAEAQQRVDQPEPDGIGGGQHRGQARQRRPAPPRRGVRAWSCAGAAGPAPARRGVRRARGRPPRRRRRVGGRPAPRAGRPGPGRRWDGPTSPATRSSPRTTSPTTSPTNLSDASSGCAWPILTAEDPERPDDAPVDPSSAGCPLVPFPVWRGGGSGDP